MISKIYGNLNSYEGESKCFGEQIWILCSPIILIDEQKSASFVRRYAKTIDLVVLLKENFNEQSCNQLHGIYRRYLRKSSEKC